MPWPFRPSLLARAITGIGLAAALASQGIAQESNPVYRPMTAKDILSGIDEGTLAAGAADSPRMRELSTARATAYILGVADSAVGQRWCQPKTLIGSDLVAAVYKGLTAQPRSPLAFWPYYVMTGGEFTRLFDFVVAPLRLLDAAFRIRSAEQ